MSRSAPKGDARGRRARGACAAPPEHQGSTRLSDSESRGGAFPDSLDRARAHALRRRHRTAPDSDKKDRAAAAQGAVGAAAAAAKGKLQVAKTNPTPRSAGKQKEAEQPAAKGGRGLKRSLAQPAGYAQSAEKRRGTRASRHAAMDGDDSPRAGASGGGAGDGGEGRNSASAAAAAMADAERALREVLEGRGRGDMDTDEDGAGAGGGAGALHGLLRRLGAGLEDLIPGIGANSSRFKGILQGLKAEGDDTTQMEALNELCELLAMANEENLATFSTDSFVPVLVNLMNAEHNPDMMLLAARALTHLMDVLPSSCHAVVHYGALNSFCTRLLTIEYIDLAEQCLEALEKLSKEHPAPVLRAGGLMAVLSYLDFFSTGVQRVALSTAANICRQLSPASADMVAEVIPNLTNILQYQDTKLVEHACVCVSRIADSWSHNADRMRTLFGDSLVENALSLLSAGSSGADTVPVKLSPPTYTALVRAIGTGANASPEIASKLLERGAHKIANGVLTCVATAVPSPGSPYARSSDQQYELLNLVSALLPSLPEAVTRGPEACTPSSPTGRVTRQTAAKEEGDAPMDDSPVAERVRSAAPECVRSEAMLAFEAKLEADSELITSYATTLYGTLIHVHEHSSNSAVRHKCMLSLWKLLYYSTPANLEVLLRTSPISSFLAGLLGNEDKEVAMAALIIAEQLLEKLPDIFRKYFMKEGVVHQLDRLMSPEADADEGDADEGARARGPRSPRPTSIRSTLKLGQRARELKIAHFAASTDAADDCNSGATKGLRQLKELCSQLSSAPGAPANADLEAAAVNDAALLGKLVLVLTEDEGASTFELLGSGTIEALKRHFTFGGLPDTLSNSEKGDWASRRLRDFVSVAMPPGSGVSSGLHELVGKLCQAYNVLERLPVVQSTPPPGASSGIAGSLSALAHPIKLRLCRASGERSLRDYSGNVVLIEPLETLQSVEDFLWPRVQRPDVPAPAPGRAEADAAKGKGKRADEPAGRMTRSMTKAAAKTDTDAPSKGKDKALEDAPDAAAPHDGAKGARASALTRALRGDVGGSPPPAEEADAMDADEDPPPLDEDDSMDDIDEDDYAHDLDDYEHEEEVPMAEPVKDIDPGTDGGRESDGGESAGAPDPGVERPPSPTGGGEADAGGSAGERKRAAASYAAAAAGGSKDGKGKASEQHFVFSIDGRDVPTGMTIISALNGALAERNAETGGQPSQQRRLWDTVHSISYRRATDSDAGAGDAERPESKGVTAVGCTGSHAHSSDALPCSLAKCTPGYDALLVLRRLWLQAHETLAARGLGGDFPAHLAARFTSTKLSSKLSRQLQDALVLSAGLPEWCAQLMQACPFLFTFEVRRQFFYGTSFGLPRALQRLQQQGVDSGTAERGNGGGSRHTQRGEPRVARLQRQKVRLSRGDIMASAFKVMDMCAGSTATLEIEYFQEVGTGLGPTLEFYTLLGHSLQERKLKLWRDDGDVPSAQNDMDTDGAVASKQGEGAPEAEMVRANCGLFPRPLATKASRRERALKHFRLLGSSVGKALQDGRLMDMHLSPAFWDLALARATDGARAADVRVSDVDPALAATLAKLGAYVDEYDALQSQGRHSEAKALAVDGATIEDLCIEWAVPGYRDAELGGGVAQGTGVGPAELRSYLVAVKDATVGAGVEQQVAAFCEGMAKVFDMRTLAPFSAEEINELVCGCTERWAKAMLVEHIKFDHGYTAASAPCGFLVEILSELGADDQRAFLRFVTGAPRLPPGGLAALSPRLTVVRKHVSGEAGNTPNNSPSPAVSKQMLLTGDLPSVMTCANYLKMPPYSTKAAMRERLMYAIHNGQGSFDLS